MDEVRRLQRRDIVASAQAEGSGADMALPYAVHEAPTNTGIWLKAIGSWTRRDLTSAQPLFPALTFDNNYSQNTYGLTGGIDFGKSEVTSPTDPFAIGLSDSFTQPFGEVAMDLDWLNKAAGWSAFAKAGAKFNKQFITTTAKGGVRYTW
jgi:hypothetical protein